MRLLTLGRSLNPLKEHRRYLLRVDTLPKFGPAQATLCGGELPVSERGASLSAPSPLTESYRGRAPAVTNAPQAAERTGFLRCVRHKWIAAGAFLKAKTAQLPKLNPFANESRRSAIPNFGARKTLPLPVQTELSLDKVKVVRNDLSDSDLDIVPLRPDARAAECADPARPLSHEGDPAWKGLRRLRARVLNVK
jgi:hypothetical protein